MTPAIWYALTGVVLFLVGLAAVIGGDHWLRKIMALNVMSSGVFLFFVALADRRPGAPPDPVPHAMVLTGIVVAVSATALAVALARRIPISAEGRETADGASE